MTKTEDIAHKSGEFIKPTTWMSRDCPICGASSGLVRIGERTYQVPTRAGNYLFHHQDVQCPYCGFVFTANVPDEEFLNIYYQNVHTHRSEITHIPPSYNTHVRLNRLQQSACIGDQILEIGASDGQFLQILNKAGFNAIGVDPLDDSEGRPTAGLVSGKDLKSFVAKQKFDAVLSYYVLEHVSNPRQWISDLCRFLRPRGTAIIEVPNFERYPTECFNNEHFQHFTKTHLKVLLGLCGFEEVRIFEEGSYYFGMTTVARLGERSQLETCLSYYRRGIESVAAINTKIGEAVLVALRAAGSEDRIVVWGASQLGIEAARQLLSQGRSDFLCVDNAASKIGRVVVPIPGAVLAPDALNRDQKHIFILCAYSGNASVLKQIRGMSFRSAYVISSDLEIREELSALA